MPASAIFALGVIAFFAIIVWQLAASLATVGAI